MNRQRVRRWALRISAAVLFLVLAGATYQGVATALERRAYPRPGGMVDVGGHQLHIMCAGEGYPLVVLEAPAAGFSASWAAVQSRAAQHTRVCSYDRAGLGYSERSDAAYDPADAPRELRTLLAQANEAAPYIIAGHGLGASFATAFASMFPDDVRALILVDPPRTGEVPTEPRALFAAPAALPWLARVGLLRATATLSALVPDLPPPSADVLRALLNRPDHLSRTAEEIARWTDAEALATTDGVGTGIRITHLATSGDRRASLALPEPHASRVVAVIQDEVARLRTDSGEEAKENGAAFGESHAPGETGGGVPRVRSR